MRCRVGADCVEDDAILAYLRSSTKSAHHPVGTCKMGRADDEDAVLTGDLCVRGVGVLPRHRATVLFPSAQ